MEKINYVKAALTLAAETDKLVKVARERFGSIHVALCHIGMVIPKPLLTYQAEEWIKAFARMRWPLEFQRWDGKAAVGYGSNLPGAGTEGDSAWHSATA